MSQFYKVLKADPLGEPWTPNAPDAKPIQNYWCQVEEEELAVSIGKQVGNSLILGESIYGDLMKATSQKGTNYWKFKSARVPDGVQRPASTPGQAVAQAAVGAVDMSSQQPAWFQPWGNMITYIYQQMKAMDADTIIDLNPAPAVPAPLVPTPLVPAPAKKVEQVGGAPIDEETQEVLDGIFSPELSPTEEADTPEGV